MRRALIDFTSRTALRPAAMLAIVLSLPGPLAAQESMIPPRGQLRYGMHVQVISEQSAGVWSAGMIGGLSRNGVAIDDCPRIFVRVPSAGFQMVSLAAVIRLRVAEGRSEPRQEPSRSAPDSAAVRWVEVPLQEVRAQHPTCFEPRYGELIR